jgi:uncharacterized Tic20 family protein
MTAPIPQGETLPPGFPQTWERNWGVFCHLGGFAAYVLPGIANILVPLVLWLMRRNESAYVDHHGREAVNFQISVTIYAIVSAVLAWLLIGFLLLAALAVFQFVLMVVASVRASQGELYRYPLTLRLIS